MGRLNAKSNARANPEALVRLITAVPAEKIVAAIIAAMHAGDVISFSRTRKANAVMLGVYDGKDNDRVYPETVEELNDALDIVLEAYGAEYHEGDTTAPPPSKRKRSREPVSDE